MTSATVPLIADIKEIQRHMPHRYPFFLIDRMVGCAPNEWVEIIKNVSHNDQFFAGVAPQDRVMPQLLLVEALAQAAGVLCHYSGMMSRIGNSIIFLAAFDNCVFGRGVRPGEQILLRCDMKRAKAGVAKLIGRAHVGAEEVLQLTLTAVIRDGTELFASK